MYGTQWVLVIIVIGSKYLVHIPWSVLLTSGI